MDSIVHITPSFYSKLEIQIVGWKMRRLNIDVVTSIISIRFPSNDMCINSTLPYY